MADQGQAIVRGLGEGYTLSGLGVTMTFKATREETGGHYFCSEYEAPPQWPSPPRHRHRETDEAFYVLEGAIAVQAGDQHILGGPGCFIHIPRGLFHTLSNPAQTPSKYLIFTFPAGMEGYFEALPAVIDQYGYPPPPHIMRQLGQQYDLELAGPQQEPR